MTTESITAVIFDWDFTLVYTIGKEIAYDERITMMLNQIGIACSYQDVQQAHRTQQADIQSGVMTLPFYPQTKPDFLQIYRDLLIRLGVPKVDEALVYKLYTEYARLPTFLYEDVLPTLQALHNCGFRLGILSNHTTSVRATIEPLVGHFIPPEQIVISEEAGFHKPEPEIYKLAARSVHASPQHCIYIGDNLHVDAIGAVQVGGFAHGFWIDRKGTGHGETFPADVTRITQLTELINILEDDLPIAM